MLSLLQNLARVQASDSDKVTVTGQFMMIRRKAYETIGGHAAVCGAICEDYELGVRLKRNGCHVQLRDGSRLLSTRMYTGWRDLWPGIGKNLVRMFGGWAPTVATVAVAVLIAWAALLVPFYDGIGCYHSSGHACVALAPALAASAAVFALHIAGTSYFGILVIYGFLFPLGYTIGAALACDGMRRILTGCITWKGVVYQ